MSVLAYGFVPSRLTICLVLVIQLELFTLYLSPEPVARGDP